mgnify:CR=1 FL=1
MPFYFNEQARMTVARQAAGWKLLNEFERVRIEIEFAFRVQAFERNDYIRVFDIFHEVHDWPVAKKDAAGIFKSVSVIIPEAFTGRLTVTMR